MATPPRFNMDLPSNNNNAPQSNNNNVAQSNNNNAIGTVAFKDASLKVYYTEAMTVPYYNVGEQGTLETKLAEWDAKESDWSKEHPTQFLRPMTKLLAHPKPMSPAYVVAQIAEENHPLKNRWGMIWSGHLRSARTRDKGVVVGGQKLTLTGVTYGYTKDVLEADENISEDIKVFQLKGFPKHGFICDHCHHERRHHKIYESTLAREISEKIKDLPQNPRSGPALKPTSVMLGTLLAIDQNGKVAYIIAGESSYSKDTRNGNAIGYGSGFSQNWKINVVPWLEKYYVPKAFAWANNEFDFDQTLIYDWGDCLIAEATKASKELQCAGPKLVQCFFQFVTKQERNKYQLFMSEVWGGTGPASIEALPNEAYENSKKEKSFDPKYVTWKKRKEGLTPYPFAFYNTGDPATSCMRCRYVIPRMLCHKERGKSKTG